MAAGARLTAGFSPLRLRNAALVVVAFAGPCLIGAPAPYLLLLLALLGYLTPSIRRSFSERTRNPVDLMLLLPVLALLTFAIAAKAPADLRYLLNFLPLLVALPYRWQLEGEARHDGLAVLATLALAGAGLAMLVGMVQVFALGSPGPATTGSIRSSSPIPPCCSASFRSPEPGCRGPGTAGSISRGPSSASPPRYWRAPAGRCSPCRVLALLAIVFAVAAARQKRRALLIAGAVAAAALRRGTPAALCGAGAGLGAGATDHPRP